MRGELQRGGMCDRVAPSVGLHLCFGLQEMLLRLPGRGQPPPSIREIDGRVYQTPHALAVKHPPATEEAWL